LTLVCTLSNSELATLQTCGPRTNKNKIKDGESFDFGRAAKADPIQLLTRIKHEIN